jgi:hypothetical protein
VHGPRFEPRTIHTGAVNFTVHTTHISPVKGRDVLPLHPSPASGHTGSRSPPTFQGRHSPACSHVTMSDVSEVHSTRPRSLHSPLRFFPTTFLHAPYLILQDEGMYPRNVGHIDHNQLKRHQNRINNRQMTGESAQLVGSSLDPLRR